MNDFLKEIVSNFNNKEFSEKDLMNHIPKNIKKKIKDPNAPKRPTTAYFCFMKEVREQVKEENSNLKVSELSKIMGKMWRDMNSDDKEKYNKEAAKDKERYKKDMETYSDQSDDQSNDNPSVVEVKEVKEKKKKDSNAPKKATTAYSYFMNDVRNEVKEEYPNQKPNECKKIMSKMWHDLEDRSKYEEMNLKDKERYKKETEEYDASK
jgi:hypothetical protein